jgi:aldehyde dehydrogenase (NAD+)
MSHASQFHIYGRWVDPISSRPFNVIDPATEKTIDVLALGSAANVDRAVTAERAALPSFPRQEHGGFQHRPLTGDLFYG